MSTLTSPSPQTTSQPKSELEDFDGKISIARAFPYGLQHVLAMFVANLAPIAIIASAAGFDDATTAMLIQNAMIVAGIGTFIQLFPIWRIGARMPIVMGVSFTFVTVLCGIAVNYGYPAAVGAVIVGGLLEGVLGLFAKYWRKFITPIVSAVVVTSIGFKRIPTEREFSGAVAADGLTSSIAGCFGCSPLTTFAQNIGLVAMTKVVNRCAIACGAGVLVLAGFIPVISAVFGSLPDAVLGGCTIMMFGNIILSGFQMIASTGFSQRNITIAAISLALGIGFTQVGEIFVYFPELLQNIFVGNSVALTFLSAVVLSFALPKDTTVEGPLVVDNGRNEGAGEFPETPPSSADNKRD